MKTIKKLNNKEKIFLDYIIRAVIFGYILDECSEEIEQIVKKFEEITERQNENY